MAEKNVQWRQWNGSSYDYLYPVIKDNSISTNKIADGAVTVAKVNLTTAALTLGKANTNSTLNGGLIIGSNMYGTSLPTTVTNGRLFFKKV